MYLSTPSVGLAVEPGNDVGVVTPEELMRWRDVIQDQRAQAAALGRVPEWERAFRAHKRTQLPPAAARAALGDVLLIEAA